MPKHQTDFGNIYFNAPQSIDFPKDSLQLAKLLKNYHQTGTQVKIRNTGHSVNGQTLTSGVQINISRIKKLQLDKVTQELTCGAGNSWHEVLSYLKQFNLCTPIFPNNPKQQIQIGGTTSVGGVGPYCSKYGGFWNQVTKIQLVSMTGEIIECSLNKNADYFRFALGGFGRIGVITEITIKTIPLAPKVLGMIFFYYREKSFYKHLEKSLNNPLFDGAILQSQLGHKRLLKSLKVSSSSLLLLTDIYSEQQKDQTIEFIKKNYGRGVKFYVRDKGKLNQETDLTFRACTFPKDDLVYYYPKWKGSKENVIHAWSDYIIDPKDYPLFLEETKRMLRKYKIDQYIMRDSVFHRLIDLQMLLTYSIKKQSSDFPLSLDLPQVTDYSYGLGVMPTISKNKLEDTHKFIQELTDLVYQLNGKRYLYGVHDLTLPQVIKQFGQTNIEKWQKIKDKLDPKHLLNIGVIEHLD